MFIIRCPRVLVVGDPTCYYGPYATESEAKKVAARVRKSQSLKATYRCGLDGIPCDWVTIEKLHFKEVT